MTETLAPGSMCTPTPCSPPSQRRGRRPSPGMLEQQQIGPARLGRRIRRGQPGAAGPARPAAHRSRAALGGDGRRGRRRAGRSARCRCTTTGPNRGLAERVTRLTNEGIAELVQAHPDRFTGLGTVPLQHPDLAIDRIDPRRRRSRAARRADRHLRRRPGTGRRSLRRVLGPRRGTDAPRCSSTPGGAPWGSGWTGTTCPTPSATRWRPRWRCRTSCSPGCWTGTPVCGWSPPTAAGTCPPTSADPTTPGRSGPRRTARAAPPSTYLRRICFDSLVYTPQALRHLVEAVGADRVVLGSDYPFDMGVPDPVDRLLAAGLDPADEHAIRGTNATAPARA